MLLTTDNSINEVFDLENRKIAVPGANSTPIK